MADPLMFYVQFKVRDEDFKNHTAIIFLIVQISRDHMTNSYNNDLTDSTHKNWCVCVN